ncbi:hypothetical protein XELAEV_18003035mg [Xenopus laevis]|nr:hypothetical protein XELAEV_18003035mg [Xenopus laevis]
MHTSLVHSKLPKNMGLFQKAKNMYVGVFPPPPVPLSIGIYMVSPTTVASCSGDQEVGLGLLLKHGT